MVVGIVEKRVRLAFNGNDVVAQRGQRGHSATHASAAQRLLRQSACLHLLPPRTIPPRSRRRTPVHLTNARSGYGGHSAKSRRALRHGWDRRGLRTGHAVTRDDQSWQQKTRRRGGMDTCGCGFRFAYPATADLAADLGPGKAITSPREKSSSGEPAAARSLGRTWRYISVVEISLCPSRSMSRWMGTPRSSWCVA